MNSGIPVIELDPSTAACRARQSGAKEEPGEKLHDDTSEAARQYGTWKGEQNVDVYL
jgi:hypothetical protein